MDQAESKLRTLLVTTEVLAHPAFPPNADEPIPR